MCSYQTIRLLENPVQTYTWGSLTALPELLGRPNPSAEPWAELWMGAHPKAPSLAVTEEGHIPLPELIETDPEGVLGERVAVSFGGRLPFLFKVLAAAKPLSIQAHPNKEQAKKGFARESAAGIPLGASERSYPDDNHKPEIICALAPFWALRGFRRTSELLELADALQITRLAAELDGLREAQNDEGLKGFFATLMKLGKVRQQAVVQQALVQAGRRREENPAYDWMVKLNEAYPGDVGVLSPVLLNLVCLQPGEAMFLPAGELHAYLEGVCIELMANSDNVLRGGLTSKHVDVPELLKTLTFSCREVEVLHPVSVSEVEQRYPSMAQEFVLSVLRPTAEHSCESSSERGVELLICTEGEATVLAAEPEGRLELKKGGSILVPAAAKSYRIEGAATLYKAAAPQAV